MSDKLDRKRAELALLEAEAEFTAKKAAGKVSREDKDDLRAMRQSFREQWRKATTDGAQPAAISTKVGV